MVTSDWFRALADIGVPGVKLFFVISGFILALPFLESRLNNARPVPLKKYFLRRVTRLEPPYIIAITMWLLIHWLVKHKSVSELAPHYLASLCYSHIFIYGQPSTLLWAAWSLEIEIQFYLLAPFIFALLCHPNAWVRRGGAILLAAISMGAANCLDEPSLAIARFTLLGQLPFFLVGFLLADVYLGQKSKPLGTLGWDLVASALWLAILLQRFWMPTAFISGQIAFAILVGFTYYASWNGRFWARLLGCRWLVIIGGMCYSIYLYHRIVLSVLSERIVLPWLRTGNDAVDLALLLGFTALAVIVSCSAVFMFLERPCMNPQWPAELSVWLRRLLKRGDSQRSQI